MMRPIVALLVCCASAVSIHAAEAPAPQARGASIAVMALDGQGVDSAAARLVTDALSDELVKTGRFRVMERSQMQRVLQEQGFQQSGACDGNECAIQVGKLLSVDHVVVGSFGRLGESHSISVRMVAVATGEVVGSSRRMQRGAIDEVVADALPEVGRDLASALHGAGDRKGSTWGYWVAGGVLVAGGVAAAVLLLNDDGGASTETNTTGGDGSWQTTVRW